MHIEEIEKITLKYISRYNKTKHGIKLYLLQKIEDAKNNQEIENNIDKVLDRFETKGYINDLTYATFKIAGRIRAGKSLRYIKNYLYEKHVNKETIERAFKELLDGQSEQDLEKMAIIKLCASKKLGPWNKNKEQASKDFNKLMQRGFLYSNIEFVINNDAKTLEKILNDLQNTLMVF